MIVTKHARIARAEDLQKNQFQYLFEKPVELESPMPKLVKLMSSIVEQIGKEQFKEIQYSILDKWAFRSGYSLEYVKESKLFKFTHVSMLEISDFRD